MMFWYPEKPQRIYSVDSVPGNYLMQVKKDGHRIIISNLDGEFKLFNREGLPITCTKGESWDWITEIFGKGFYLDGEVIGRRQGEVIDTIVVWDMLYHDNLSLHSLSYGERHNLLKQFIEENLGSFLYSKPKYFGTHFIAHDPGPMTWEDGRTLLLSRNYTLKDFPKVWKELEKDSKYNEGVVFKNPAAKLKWSLSSTQKSPDQLKLKIRD